MEQNEYVTFLAGFGERARGPKASSRRDHPCAQFYFKVKDIGHNGLSHTHQHSPLAIESMSP